MEEKSVTIVVATAETHVELDASNPAAIGAVVKSIMDAQVNREHDGVDQSELSDEDLLCRNLRDLAEAIGRRDGSVTSDESAWTYRKYGSDFKNETFEMQTYWWGSCECGFEEKEDLWFERENRERTPSDLNAAYVEWRKEHDHAEDCPEHPNNTRAGLPNFKCGDVEVDWYKYIGRGISLNRELSRSEIEGVFRNCFASLE